MQEDNLQTKVQLCMYNQPVMVAMLKGKQFEAKKPKVRFKSFKLCKTKVNEGNIKKYLSKRENIAKSSTNSATVQYSIPDQVESMDLYM